MVVGASTLLAQASLGRARSGREAHERRSVLGKGQQVPRPWAVPGSSQQASAAVRGEVRPCPLGADFPETDGIRARDSLKLSPNVADPRGPDHPHILRLQPLHPPLLCRFHTCPRCRHETNRERPLSGYVGYEGAVCEGRVT